MYRLWKAYNSVTCRIFTNLCDHQHRDLIPEHFRHPQINPKPVSSHGHPSPPSPRFTVLASNSGPSIWGKLVFFYHVPQFFWPLPTIQFWSRSPLSGTCYGGPPPPVPNSVSVSYCYCNKSPHTQFTLTVLRVMSPKRASRGRRRGVGRAAFLPGLQDAVRSMPSPASGGPPPPSLTFEASHVATLRSWFPRVTAGEGSLVLRTHVIN